MGHLDPRRPHCVPTAAHLTRVTPCYRGHRVPLGRCQAGARGAAVGGDGRRACAPSARGPLASAVASRRHFAMRRSRARPPLTPLPPAGRPWVAAPGARFGVGRPRVRRGARASPPRGRARVPAGHAADSGPPLCPGARGRRATWLSPPGARGVTSAGSPHRPDPRSAAAGPRRRGGSVWGPNNERQRRAPRAPGPRSRRHNAAARAPVPTAPVALLSARGASGPRAGRRRDAGPGPRGAGRAARCWGPAVARGAWPPCRPRGAARCAEPGSGRGRRLSGGPSPAPAQRPPRAPIPRRPALTFQAAEEEKVLEAETVPEPSA